MKNYYELLEVSENASPEVIEKAYKTLVKKYHPDLQPNDKKLEAENKIKIINEAYEILSDKDKKEKYDEQLKSEKIKEEKIKYDQINKNYHNNNNSQNSIQKRPIRKPKAPHPQDSGDNYDFQNEYTNMINEAYNNAYQNAYNQAYINTLRNMGYEIQYERPFKEKVKLFFSTIVGIIIFVFICFILLQIPPIKNYFINLYNNNDIFKIFIDILNNIFQSFLNLFSSKK